MRHQVTSEIERLARCQGEMVSREQALGLGLTRHSIARLVASGTWQRPAPGLFLTAGREPEWIGWAWAAVLAGGVGARLTGRAAAFRHRLIDEPPADLLVLIPAARGPIRGHYGPVSWRFRRETPGTRDHRTVGSPPMVKVEDAVLDLVDEAETQEVAGWVTAAVQRRLTTPTRLRTAATGRPRLRHRRLLDELLCDVAAGAHSALELRYLRDVERPHGLPAGSRQVRRRGTVADVLYADYGLLIELDGRIGHTGEGRFRDMRRDNMAATDGLATLRYGWHDVSGAACSVARQVANTLELRGWLGTSTTCSYCRLVTR